MDGYKIRVILDNVDITTARTVLLPRNISFKTLHEIICILFNLDKNKKYKFPFEDIGLIIQDTGSLNRDRIDSRFEIVDEYFLAYSEIKYLNSFWNLRIIINHVKYEKKYPEIISIEGKYNPSNEIFWPEDFSDALNLKVNEKIHNEKLLKRVKIQDIQEHLLLLFKIPYAIENKKIIIINQESILDNYFN